MPERIRVRLDFTIVVNGPARGLARVVDFVQGGLKAVLAEEDFPVDIEPGAKGSLKFYPDRTKKRGKTGENL